MDPNLFFQKCKPQYWDKLNEVKTPWVLVGTASSKHIKSAYRTAWTFIMAVFQNDRKHVGRNLIQTLAAIFIL